MAIKHLLLTAVCVDTPDVSKGQILDTITLQDIPVFSCHRRGDTPR